MTTTAEALMALADAYANAKMWCTSETAEERRAALASALAEVVKDAERYRWLRDVSVPPHNFYLSVPVEFDGVRFTPGEVDAAIDAALAARSAEQKGV